MCKFKGIKFSSTTDFGSRYGRHQVVEFVKLMLMFSALVTMVTSRLRLLILLVHPAMPRVALPLPSAGMKRSCTDQRGIAYHLACILFLLFMLMCWITDKQEPFPIILMQALAPLILQLMHICVTVTPWAFSSMHSCVECLPAQTPHQSKCTSRSCGPTSGICSILLEEEDKLLIMDGTPLEPRLFPKLYQGLVPSSMLSPPGSRSRNISLGPPPALKWEDHTATRSHVTITY